MHHSPEPPPRGGSSSFDKSAWRPMQGRGPAPAARPARRPCWSPLSEGAWGSCTNAPWRKAAYGRFAPRAVKGRGPGARAELPLRVGCEEVAVTGARMAGQGGARAAAQHELVAHELAVVFAHRADRRPAAGIGGISRLRPLPDAADELHRRGPLQKQLRCASGACAPMPRRPCSANTLAPSSSQYSGARRSAACIQSQPMASHSSGRRPGSSC